MSFGDHDETNLPPPAASDQLPAPLAVSAPRRRRRRGWLVAATALLVITGGVVGVAGTRQPDKAPSANASAATSTQGVDTAVIQDRYGVRIDLVGLSALGGLVELRFTVLDADKAVALFHDDTARPTLMVQPSGELLQPPATAHKMSMLNGASYFVLYANKGNAVRGGTAVSLAMGDVRLDGLVVAK